MTVRSQSSAARWLDLGILVFVNFLWAAEFPAYTVLLVSCPLAMLFSITKPATQNGSQHASAQPPKYRTSFSIYDVGTKMSKTIFRINGEWHAPNWTSDGKYMVSDMGGAVYQIPVRGANAGKPEKIDANQKINATNDHALSWDGKQIAITGLTLPLPPKARTPADLRNPLFVMNMDGSNAHEVHLGWFHGWSPDGKYLVYTQYRGDNFDFYRINADGVGRWVRKKKMLGDHPRAWATIEQ